MKNLFLVLFTIAVFTACSKNEVRDVSIPNQSSSLKATWSSTDKWATYSTGGYFIENDVWGSNPGTQSIWANSYNNWGFWANHTGGGIKAYPNVDKSINKSVLSLSKLTSNFSASTAGGSNYDLAYDIWCNGNGYETMLWYNWNGTQPIAQNYDASGNAVPELKNQSIGGSTWNVYRRGTVFSFLRTSKTNSGSADIKAVLLWINNKGWFNNPTLTKVQFGWEILSCPSGGGNYSISSYDVSQ